MATFYANPNEENWIEKSALEGYGFRNWHLMVFSISGIITLLTLICCCVKFRIPRTKQEIEGDYRRRQLAEKFQERLRIIQNKDNGITDLQQALRLIQDDFDQENRKMNEERAPQDCQGAHIELGVPPVNTKQPRFAEKFSAIILAANIRPNNV